MLTLSAEPAPEISTPSFSTSVISTSLTQPRRAFSKAIFFDKIKRGAEVSLRKNPACDPVYSAVISNSTMKGQQMSLSRNERDKSLPLTSPEAAWCEPLLPLARGEVLSGSLTETKLKAQKAGCLQHKSLFAAQRPCEFRIKWLCFSQRGKVTCYSLNTTDTGAEPHSVPGAGEPAGYSLLHSHNATPHRFYGFPSSHHCIHDITVT